MQSVVDALEAASQVEDTPPRGADLVQAKLRTQSAFFQAMHSWSLSEQQTAALAWQRHERSNGNRDALFMFDEKLRPREVQIFCRIAQVLEIFLLCRKVFVYDTASALWLKAPSDEISFCNLAPLTWMIHGGNAGIKQVRDYLETISPPAMH